MATELERLRLIEDRLAIEALNTDFCIHLDHGDIDALVALFTADAFYAHGQRVSVGRNAIRALFDQRASAGIRTSRHMYSGLKTKLAGDRASGLSVCMTFAQDAAAPIVPAIPYLVADFVDEYQLCEDGQWRIAKRQINRIFMDASNAGPVAQDNASKTRLI